MPNFSATNTSQKALSKDSARKRVILQNQSDAQMIVRLFRDAPGEGLKLGAESGSAAGGSIVLEGDDAEQEVWVRHNGTGDKTLYYCER